MSYNHTMKTTNCGSRGSGRC